MSNIFEAIQHLFVLVATAVLAAIPFITPGHKVESPPKLPPTVAPVLPVVTHVVEQGTKPASPAASKVLGTESGVESKQIRDDTKSTGPQDKVVMTTPSPVKYVAPPLTPTLNSTVPTTAPSPNPYTPTEPSPPSPATQYPPTSTPQPPAQVPAPDSTPTSIPTSQPSPPTMADNTQISFKVYWETSHGAHPLADYSSSVCLGNLDVVWAHFFLIDPSGQEQNIGNQDYRQKPCGVLNVIGYPLTGKPLGEYILKVVFDELGVTKTAKATLGPPQI